MPLHTQVRDTLPIVVQQHDHDAFCRVWHTCKTQTAMGLDSRESHTERVPTEQHEHTDFAAHPVSVGNGMLSRCRDTGRSTIARPRGLPTVWGWSQLHGSVHRNREAHSCGSNAEAMGVPGEGSSPYCGSGGKRRSNARRALTSCQAATQLSELDSSSLQLTSVHQPASS